VGLQIIWAIGASMIALAGAQYLESLNIYGDPRRWHIHSGNIAASVMSFLPFCRWVAAMKVRRTDWWLSYV
jgi:hypothetical protein